MKLGVCYYPEHWPPERWPEDARQMREAGLSLVRLGEFAWQQMEPQAGQYDWGWLDQAITVLAAEGLHLVLCTPTAIPPAWLCHAHPEILPVDAEGRRRQFGSRRHYCPNSFVYRDHTRRIVTALAERYGRHPAVVGWQIDNEFGCHDTARCYCAACAGNFRDWLARRYGSLAALNEAWGTVFWSQGYSAWNEINPPNLTVTEANPSQVLDYYHCASDSFVRYQQLQLDLLRQHSPTQPVTTNFMGNFPDLDYHALARPLDWVTWDSYPSGFVEVQARSLYGPDEPRPKLAYDAGDPYVTGFCHDLTRGLKQRPFWVMEQQCGHVNWGRYNTAIRPGTVRLWTWHALAAGAEAVIYFRWRASLNGQEQFHSGLRHHDASPAPGYADLLCMLSERAQMADLAATPHTAPVALLLDYADLWALQLQPHHQDFGYLRHLFIYYRALQRLGLTTDIVPADADLTRYGLVIAPSAHLVSDGLAATLTAYVQGGGALLLGVRSGFKTPTNRVTDQPLPGLLRELVGAHVLGWGAVPPEAAFDLDSPLAGLGGAATVWAEALALDEPGMVGGATAVAHYRTGLYADCAALVENALGAGRVYYAGFYPTLQQAEALVAHLAAQARLPVLAPLPWGVVAARRGARTLLLNFTDHAANVRLSGHDHDVPPRGVRICGIE